MLKVFYADYSEDKILDPQDARSTTKEEILHIMNCTLHMPSNFIGISDRYGLTLQFMVNDDSTIHVEVPDPGQHGSYVRTTSLEVCLELIRCIGDFIDLEQIGELKFESW